MENKCSNLYFILFYTFAFSIQTLNQKIQMKQTFNFLLMLVMVATVLSCKKKDVELTPAQKIVGKYKFTASSSISNGITRDNLSGRPVCVADDISEFTTDGKLIDSEGATSCTPPRSFGASRTYVLSPDGKALTVTSTDNSSGVVRSDIYTVEELTDSILKVTITITENIQNGGTITVKVNSTLTKI